jgi:hypothetical protein
LAAAPSLLDRRALNRALLARQLLLKRHNLTAPATLERLVGMQAQAPNLPYVGLWSRLEGFRHEQLSRLVENKQTVRISLMRNTIHLVTTRDALGLKPLFVSFGERGFLHGSPWGRGLKQEDMKAALEVGHELMSEKPRTIAELTKLLRQRFPGRDANALAYGVRYMLPMVFTPPRGTWGGRGLVTLMEVEAWLGRPLGPPSSPDRFVRRYLAAFGPASPADFRAWSGLAMREVFERLRPRLKVFRNDRGAELFDIPDAPRPAGDTPAPVRFLPDFDNILLAHADRTRIMPTGKHLGMFSSNGTMMGSVLADGFVRAKWAPVKANDATTLIVTPFEKPIAKKEAGLVAEEGLRLLKFLAPGDEHEVRFAAVQP